MWLLRGPDLLGQRTDSRHALPLGTLLDSGYATRVWIVWLLASVSNHLRIHLKVGTRLKMGDGAQVAGGVPRAVTLSEQSARSQRCALRGVDDTSYVPIWDRIVQTCFTDQLAGIVLGTVGRYPRCLVGWVGCRSAVVCSEEAESQSSSAW